MTLSEVQDYSRPKAGIIPWYVGSDGDRRIMLMVPSDPAYGGTSWQIAKGSIDPGETAEQAARREGQEELGLRHQNIKNISRLLNQHEIQVFLAEISDPQAFDTPHYETGDTIWLKFPQEQSQIRRTQQWIFQALRDRWASEV